MSFWSMPASSAVSVNSSTVSTISVGGIQPMTCGNVSLLNGSLSARSKNRFMRFSTSSNVGSVGGPANPGNAMRG
jgi:hypothetical protein